MSIEVINRTLQIKHPDGYILYIHTNDVILNLETYGYYFVDGEKVPINRDGMLGNLIRAKLLYEFISINDPFGGS